MDELSDLKPGKIDFEHIFNITPDLIFILDSEYNILRANDAFAKRTGMSSHDLIGSKCYRCMHQADKPPFDCPHARMLSDHQEHTENMFSECLHGWFSVAVKPLKDEHGKVYGSLHIARDISENNKKEAELAIAQQRYRELFENVNIGILRSTPGAEGAFIDVNPAMVKMFEADSREQLMALHPSEIYWDASQRKIVSDAVLDKGFIKTEVKFRTIRGKPIWCHILGIKKTGTDGQIYFDTTIEDFTERKKAELLLRKLNRTYSLLSEVNQMIVRVHEKQELFNEACKIAVSHGGFRMAWIGLLDTETRQVNPVAHAGDAGNYLERLKIILNESDRGHGPTATALRTGRHIVANDIASDPWMAPWHDDALLMGYSASAVFPFNLAGELRGTLTLYAPEKNFFDEEELKLLDEMTADIAFALEYIEEEQQRKQAEESLRNSEIKLRSVLDATPFPIALVDLQDDNISFWSKSAMTLFGHTATTASAWYALAYPDPLYRLEVIERWKTALDKAKQSDSTFNTGAYQVTCKDGSVRICELHAKFLAENLIVTFNDITNQRQAQNELSKSEAEFRMLAESVPQIVWITRPDGWNIYFNQQWVDYTGQSMEESYGDGWNKPFHPDDQKRAWDAWQNAVSKGTTYSLECRLRRADGLYKWWLVRGVPQIDNHGNVIKWFGTCTDIDELKRSEKDLRYTQSILQAALDQSQAGIAIAEAPDGLLRYVNEAGLLIRGGGQREIVDGIGIDQYVSSWQILDLDGTPLKPDEVPLARAILFGEKNSREFIVRRDTDDDRSVLANAAPIKDESGNVIAGIVVFLDITEQKLVERSLLIREEELIIAKEKAEASDRLKSAFLANMSHEIRTPMNGILGFAELLKEPRLTGEEQQHYINIIERSGKRMLNVINDIVNISRIEAGQMGVSVSVTQINDQIQHVTDFFKPEAERKGLQLRVGNTLPVKESRIHTDREKLYAILTNLLGNAMKCTNAGFIELGVDRKTDFLEFYVKDTGIGIPENQQEIIFERFRQGGDLTNQFTEGTGLGLSITKAYVELLGGKIRVESKPGEGSVFYFTFPFNPENETETTGKKIPADTSKGKIADNLKILVVEDDEDSKYLITNIIRKFGKEILFAATGGEAVEASRTNPDIDLILMDIRMPDMDGYKATRQIREFNTEVIIIAQTAYAMSGDREKAIAAGCNDYIAKPIKIQTFNSLIQGYFRKS